MAKNEPDRCVASIGGCMNNDKMLAYELMGVIADAKAGKFDEVCIETLKRVCAALSTPADGGEQAVAYIRRNEYDEYRLEPVDGLDIKQFPVEQEVLLYTRPSPAANIPDGWKLVPVEDEREQFEKWWADEQRGTWPEAFSAEQKESALAAWMARAASPTPPQQQEQSGEAFDVALLENIRVIMNKYGYQCRDMADEIVEAAVRLSPATPTATASQESTPTSDQTGREPT
jgi:hypothetical protein